MWISSQQWRTSSYFVKLLGGVSQKRCWRELMKNTGCPDCCRLYQEVIKTHVTWPSPPQPASDQRPSSVPSGWPPAPPPSGGSGRSCFSSSHRWRNSQLPLFNQFSWVNMFLNTVTLVLRLKVLQLKERDGVEMFSWLQSGPFVGGLDVFNSLYLHY